MSDNPAPGNDGLQTVRAGFIPLVDCAVLAVAAEKGFAAAEGIDLKLVKEVSWANVRDKLNVGLLDCAHMLAGMPVATTLGIGQARVDMVAPMALGINGNAITVSKALYASLGLDETGFPDPAQAGAALKAEIERRASAGEAPLTFGMVFPFSTHNYQLRYWLAASGIDPDRDVRLVVIPPPYMVDSLAAGQLDGFCVGEPWNSLAVDRDMGRILLPGTAICDFCPEKVLGLHTGWAEENADVLARLLKALAAAARWASTPDNRNDVAALLAQDKFLGVDAGLIARALTGQIVPQAGAGPVAVDGFLILNRDDATRPRPNHALWLLSQMVRWGQTVGSKEQETQAAAVFAPTMFDNAMGGEASPNDRAPHFFDGLTFLR